MHMKPACAPKTGAPISPTNLHTRDVVRKAQCNQANNTKQEQQETKVTLADNTPKPPQKAQDHCVPHEEAHTPELKKLPPHTTHHAFIRQR